MKNGVKRLVWLAVLVMLVFIVLAFGIRGRAAGSRPAQGPQTPAPAQTAEAAVPAESDRTEAPAEAEEAADDETAEPEATTEPENTEAPESAAEPEESETPEEPSETGDDGGIVITEDEDGSVIIEIPGDMGIGEL